MRPWVVERLTRELGSWGGAPVFAYGLRTHRGRMATDRGAGGARRGHVSLPVEPGRAVFASLSRTVDDLAALADGDIVELAGRVRACPRGGLAQLERHLFEDAPTAGVLDGSIRFLEGAGRRATLELLAESVLDLVRDGLAPEQIAVVCPSLERSRAPLPYAILSLRLPPLFFFFFFFFLDRVRAGAALAPPLAWSNGTRRELFAFLRTPYGGSRPRRRRLPGGPAAGPGGAPRRPHRRGDDEAAHRGARCRCSSSSPPRRYRSPPPGPSCSRCSATRTGSARRP